MDVEESTSTTTVSSSVSTTKEVKIKEEPMETESKDDIKEPEKAPEEEKKFEMLQNPCRALNQQLKVINLSADNCRYTPLKPLSAGGIILLRDGKPNDPEVRF